MKALASLLLAMIGFLPAASLAAQESAAETEQQTTQDQTAVPDDATPQDGDGAETSSGEDPCSVVKASNEARIDQFRRRVFETVCGSAQWFDGFFGSRRFDEEARQTNGRVGALLIYDEHGGVEVDGTFKVRVDFPNLEHRVNAFLGRDDQQDFLTGSERQLDFLPTFFESQSNQEWLLGLGYSPVGRSERSSLDFDVGVDFGSPIDPFVRGQYRRLWLVGDESLLRARESVYWTNERGVGSGTRLDFETPVGRRTLGRIVGNVVHDGQTEGVDWDAGATLYHGFSNDKAISWFVGIDGESGNDVPVKSYGTRVTFRQRMLREWFFGQLVTGVTWPRDNPLEQREMAWHFGFGFEIAFSGADLGIGPSERR